MKERFQKAGKYLRKGLATALAGFVFATSGHAGPVEIETPKTKIEIPFEDPRTNADANTKMTAAAKDISGRGVEYGFQKSGLENSVLGRITEAGIDAGLYKVLRDASHESGHTRMCEKLGVENVKIHLNLNPFEQSSYSYDKISENPDEILNIVSAGPNQDSLNGVDFFRTSQLRPSNYYDEIFNAVNAASQFGNILDFQGTGEGNDYIKGAEMLNKKGHNSSLGQMRINAGIPSLLSLGKSAKNIWDFVIHGKRKFEPTYLNINENLKIGFPNFSYFFTPKGEFIDMSEFAKVNGQTLEVDVANSISGDLDTLRIGGKIYNIPVTDNLSVSPYAHVNLERGSFGLEGVSAGIEGSYKINKNYSLIGEIGYHENDLIANGVKGKKNGFDAVLGVSFNF